MRINDKPMLKSEHYAAYMADDDYALHHTRLRGSLKGLVIDKHLAMIYYKLKLATVFYQDYDSMEAFRIFRQGVRAAYTGGKR